MAKSAAFGVMHLGIAFGVSYALTGSVAIAGRSRWWSLSSIRWRTISSTAGGTARAAALPAVPAS